MLSLIVTSGRLDHSSTVTTSEHVVIISTSGESRIVVCLGILSLDPKDPLKDSDRLLSQESLSISELDLILHDLRFLLFNPFKIRTFMVQALLGVVCHHHTSVKLDVVNC